MPLKFDLHRYQSNWDPTAKGTFVSPQDVLAANGDMWAKVWQTMLSFIPTQDQINNIVQQGLTDLLNDMFPATGSSDLVTQLSSWTGVDFMSLATDLSDAITTGDWNPLLDLLFGTTAFTSGSTIQVPALPSNIPQSYISGLSAALTTFITTGDWNPLLTALYGSTTVGSTIAVTAVPTGIPQANIANLTADLADAITTGDWNPLLSALYGSTTVASTIQSAAVPSLDTSKITTGTFAQSFISGLTSLWNGWFGTTTPTGATQLLAATVPSLAASKITTGIFGTALIPALDASKITTGTFPNTMSPGLLPQSLWQAAAGSNNLVISPNFEDTTIARTTLQVGKTGATFGYSTAVARSGTHSYAITTDSSTASNDLVFLSPTTVGGETGLTDASAIKVQPGQWFYSEIYVRGNAANIATAGSLLIGAYLADSSGVNATINPHLSATVSAGGLSSTVWTKISGWYQIPAGYDRLWPILWVTGVNAAAQTYYFDDVRIVENTQAQAIAQQLFGGGNILSTILAATVPALDASKITTGTFTSNTMFPNLLPQTLWQAGQGSGTNLILSPQFDDSTIARATGSFGQTVPAVFGYSTTVARSGTQSYKVITSTPTTVNNDVFYLMPSNATSLTAANAIKVQAGQWFYGEFYVRADAANTTTTGTIQFRLAAQSTTGTPAAVNLLLGFVNMSGLSSTAWTKVSGWVQIPTGYDIVYPFAWLINCATPAQTFYFDDARLIEDTQAQAITQQLFGGSSVLSAILAATVPSLDASKITTGTFAQSFVSGLTSLWSGWFGTTTPTGSTQLLPATVPSLDASKIATGSLGTAQIPALDASKITSGTFAQSFISGLAAIWTNLFGAGTPATSPIVPAVVPGLDASKITSGSLTGATVPGSQLTGSVLSSLLSGAVALGLIPALPASQVTSGTFGAGLIPSLDASKITSGTFAQSMVTNLTSAFNNLFGIGNDPTTSPVAVAAVPALDASKITSGSLTGATVPGSQLTGNVLSSLLSGAIALGLIPALPASQVTSGAFAAAQIPSLDASKIVSGSLTGATVPGSQLTGSVLSSLLSGAVALGLIPALPASQVTSGTFGAGLIPSLDASKIATGTMSTAVLPNVVAGTGPGQSTDLQTHFNNVVAELLGLPVTTGQTPATAATALGNVNNTLVALSSQIQSQQTQQIGASQYGKAYAVRFNTYPDGPFSVTPFTITTTGTGTGHLVMSGGQAQWSAASNGDVSVVGIYMAGYTIAFTGTPTSFTLTYNGQTTSAITYSTVTAAAIQTALQALSNMPANNVTVIANATGGFNVSFVLNGSLSGAITGTGTISVTVLAGVTNTDYQELQATIGGLPNGGGSRNYALLRCNPAGTTYVYGVVYLAASGLSLNWELGCYVAGVHTVLFSGTNAPLNINFTFRAGVGGNPYRFQGISGNQIVFDDIDAAHVSQVGAGFRAWGFRSDTANGGQATPAPASYVGCSDNAPPTTQGSGFRMSCSSPTARSLSVSINTAPPPASPVWAYFPTGFFDTTNNITPDIVASTTAGHDSVTILTEGWYLFEVRCQQTAVSGNSIVSIYAGYMRGTGGGAPVFESLANGASVACNVFSTQWAPTSFGGNCPIYCRPGDTIIPIIYCDTASSGFLSSFAIYGEVNNRLSYWSMTRMFGNNN